MRLRHTKSIESYREDRAKDISLHHRGKHKPYPYMSTVNNSVEDKGFCTCMIKHTSDSCFALTIGLDNGLK